MYIIIGQGAAGTSAAFALRQIDGTAPITVISDEPDFFYSRVDLPDIIAGKRAAQDAVLRTAEQFADQGITCRMGEPVQKILPDQKKIELNSETIAYDKLLLATGSVPVQPAIPGGSAPGIHYLWTLRQARDIVHAAETASRAVVVGAGLIGLKTALALVRRGVHVTVVEKLPRVMPQQLDDTGSSLLLEKLIRAGLVVRLGEQVTAFATDSGCICGVELGGEQLDCDFAVVAVGVRPNIRLAKEAGITVNKGIVTDSRLATSIPDIYAAGDVAEVADLLSGRPVVPAIWPAAVEQGAAAARSMAGEGTAYQGSTGMNSVEIAGLPIISVGDIQERENDTILAVRQQDSYRKILIHDKIVQGVLFMGDIRQAGVAANLVLRRSGADEIDLLAPTFSFADIMGL